MSYGFVYILANEAMPNIYKIGCTEKSPSARAHELSRSTGVPLHFNLVCYAEYENFQEMERELHNHFADRRVNDSREFFYGPLSAIYEYLERYTNHLSFGKSEGEYFLYEEERKALAEFQEDLFFGQSADPIHWPTNRGLE